MILRLLATAVFYLVVTPLAWVMRRLGRDPLRRALDPAAETYWTNYVNSTAADLRRQR